MVLCNLGIQYWHPGMSRCAQQFKGQIHKAHKESRNRHPKGKLPFLYRCHYWTYVHALGGWFGFVWVFFWNLHFRLVLSLLLDFKHTSFSASSHLHRIVGELERIWPFLVHAVHELAACVGSLCWYHLQSRGTRGSRASATAHTGCCSQSLSDQEASLAAGTQLTLSMWCGWMVQLFFFQLQLHIKEY